MLQQMGEHSMGIPFRRRSPDLGRSNSRFRSMANHRYRHRIHDMAVWSRTMEARPAGGKEHRLAAIAWNRLDVCPVLDLHQNRWLGCCVLLYWLRGPASDKCHFVRAVDVEE